MNKVGKILLIVTCLLGVNAQAQQLDKNKNYVVAPIAFYNFENLFDTIVDPDTTKILQEEFTPHGKNNWNSKRYHEKLDNMASVVAQLGTEVNPDGPAILGVCEIENKSVLDDFVKQEKIKSSNYQIVHYNSPDRRGIDVGFLYNPKYFTVSSSKTFTVKNPENDKWFTRDQLLVSGDLLGERIHVIVAHWPSRRGGQKKSSPKRELAADVGRVVVDSILKSEPNAKIFYMGDLNDDPTNVSVKKHLLSNGNKSKTNPNQLFNPMEELYKSGIGTLAWNDSWNLFDQILVSHDLTKSDYSSLRYYKAVVFNKDFLKSQEGRFKGYPKRTYSFGEYAGGYSDHFPVYLFLIKER
ncbi:endonuclease/exonuclease/phosphatase family protein [Flavobacteriales bacterium]|nr:endonuclease/exonuclease/phosphatase family protein [Flavobacteriales bacterium]